MKKHLLRITLALLVFSSSFFTAKAQWVSIPDTSFRNFLTSKYPACMNGNLMDTTCTAIVNEDSVDCYSKNIYNLSGIEYFDNLEYLECSHNHLAGFAVLPARLRWLDCEANYITSLPLLPDTLEYLDCGRNNIGSIAAFPDSLQIIWVNDNSISVLPALPPGIISLRCDQNQLTALPSLPATLDYLLCGDNQISSIPALPMSMITLDIGGNPINPFPVLPDTLQWFSCGNMQLTALPNPLPIKLKQLVCSYNLLTALPPLPSTMTNLYCDRNLLTSLPALPAGLIAIDCDHNNLTSLPDLPPTVWHLFCRNNPLSCLPYLTHILNLYFDSTNVTCLPNYGNVGTSSPPLNSLPLCNPFNNNGCDILWNLEGNVYFDANTNCLKEASDTAQKNIKIQLWSGSNLVQQTFTGGEGLYSFDTDSLGSYTIKIDTAQMPFDVLCPAIEYWNDTLSAVDSFKYNNDFALNCKPGFDVTAHSIWGVRFRPAGFATVNIGAGDITNFYGAHCAAGVSGTVTTTITGSVTYISPALGALTPSVSGNVLTYNIADFGTTNFFTDFDILVQTDTNAMIGSQVCFTVSVTPTVGDNNPANNTLSHCFTVVGSFDPNDKQVYPEGDIEPNQEWLTYTINFQNTGTDTAQHIYVTDTLDSDLDVSSFQLLAYSDQPVVQIKENAVRFNFPNINLPDSNTNEPLSHGYVQYKIKLKDNLPIGTQINNTAFIYFDFNAPVVTNTTSNTIAVISSVGEIRNQKSEIRVYPNPASDAVIISVDESMVGGTVVVSDVTGRKMAAVQLITTHQSLTTSNFSSGVYFVTVTDKEGRSATKKLVVSK